MTIFIKFQFSYIYMPNESISTNSSLSHPPDGGSISASAVSNVTLATTTASLWHTIKTDERAKINHKEVLSKIESSKAAILDKLESKKNSSTTSKTASVVNKQFVKEDSFVSVLEKIGSNIGLILYDKFFGASAELKKLNKKMDCILNQKDLDATKNVANVITGTQDKLANKNTIQQAQEITCSMSKTAIDSGKTAIDKIIKSGEGVKFLAIPVNVDNPNGFASISHRFHQNQIASLGSGISIQPIQNNILISSILGLTWALVSWWIIGFAISQFINISNSFLETISLEKKYSCINKDLICLEENFLQIQLLSEKIVSKVQYNSIQDKILIDYSNLIGENLNKFYHQRENLIFLYLTTTLNNFNDVSSFKKEVNKILNTSNNLLEALKKYDRELSFS